MVWSRTEDELLRRAVSIHGTAWAVIVREGTCGARSAGAMRWRWNVIGGDVQSPPDDIPAPLALSDLALPPGQTLMWEPTGEATRGRKGRSRTGGRPWDYYVSRSPCPSRALS